MKSTTFIAVLLTLLSLLLVVGAAALFLFQGRQDLLDEAARLENDVQALNLDAAQLQTTVDAQEATRLANESTLSQSLLQLAARETEVAQAQATLGALQATLTAQPPTATEPPILDILSPTHGVSAPSDSALNVIVVAFANVGVERIVVQLSDRQESLTTVGSGETYVSMNRRVLDPTPGALTITATLTTVDNQMQQSSIQILVNSAPAQPEDEGEDNQGLVPAPVADLRP